MGGAGPRRLSGPRNIEQIHQTEAFLDQVVDDAPSVRAERPGAHGRVRARVVDRFAGPRRDLQNRAHFGEPDQDLAREMGDLIVDMVTGAQLVHRRNGLPTYHLAELSTAQLTGAPAVGHVAALLTTVVNTGLAAAAYRNLRV